MATTPEAKKWTHSKTVWANIILAVAVVIQALTGTEWLDAEAQGAIIVVINLVLRILTKQPLSR